MPTRAPLLDDNDQFTPKAQKALLEIFTKYDKDTDGLLNKEELDAFATDSNGEPVAYPSYPNPSFRVFDQDSLDDLFANFDNEDGKLTKDGFLDMFHLQTLSDEDETYKDLENHGYGPDLEKL
ncbi:hypothetical protein HDV00_009065 [Rhizophlyctis rosea]|nr:hypothetical protein HDV00_009065 [Rhizophlyctis rosea]